MKVDSIRRIISLDKEDAEKLCRPGQGQDTCIWLVVGPGGFECLYYNRDKGKNLKGETLEQQWKAGKTVAKRDGCDVVKAVFWIDKVGQLR